MTVFVLSDDLHVNLRLDVLTPDNILCKLIHFLQLPTFAACVNTSQMDRQKI
jgi:hypothetical protein